MKLSIHTAIKRILISLSLFLLVPFVSFTQSAERNLVASGGGTFSNASFSVDYSVGEAVVQTFSSAGLALTQGFQQPPYSDVSVEEPENQPCVLFYPNPGRDLFHLTLYTDNSSGLEVQVIDILGQVIWSHQNSSSGGQKVNLDLQLGFLATGTYMLRVSDGSRTESIPFVKVSM